MGLILLSAFEPFGRDEMNSSRIVLDMISDSCGRNPVEKTVLPVIYEKAFDTLISRSLELDPDYIICMGQAGGRKKISIERIAVNINSSEMPDNEGNIRKDLLIKKDGPAAFMSGIPFETYPEDVVMSYSAGTFVCNDLFYRLLSYKNAHSSKTEICFIHLPYTEHFGKIPLIESKKQAQTMERMLSVLGE